MIRIPTFTSRLAAISVFFLCLSTALAASFAKATLVVPIADEATWHDMAYLAAIPASEVQSPSGGSLLAIHPEAGSGPEVADYLRRYKPEALYLLGVTASTASKIKLPTSSAPQMMNLPATSAENAALTLSRQFWKTSKWVVICREDDYASALSAAPLASLLKAPLLYATNDGISLETEKEIKRLGAGKIVTIGFSSSLANATNLADAKGIMTWVKQYKIDVKYLAAVNPRDRTISKVKKLSLTGAQLAAGRKGLLAPLPFEVEWKKPFASIQVDEKAPQRFQNQNPPAGKGTFKAGDDSFDYYVTGNPSTNQQQLFIARDGTENISGPHHSGDTIEINQKKWTLSLGAGSSFYTADVHLTWPQVDVVKNLLHEYYHILGLPPTYLCLVGLPDAIPHHIVRGFMVSSDIATDLPYAMYVDEQSAQIAVGRMVAEDVRYGCLYAARVITYHKLLDADWSMRACQAEWENSFAPLFSHVGFDASYRLSDEEISRAEKSGASKPQSEQGYAADSPFTRASLLCHINHSWNFELGRTMKWDATTLIAPSVVESGGCGTTSLDRSAPGQVIIEGASGAQSPELAVKHRSVVSRLFRLGAVSFLGGSREMSTQQLPLRQEFWSSMLAGQSVGIAHLRAQNTAFLIINESEKNGSAGGYRHVLNARTLMGDPAVTVRVPSAPRYLPAKTALSGKRVVVDAPQKWEVVKLFVPPDWKQWANRDIFVARACGAYCLSSWGAAQRDVEVPFVMAEFRSAKKIKSLTPVAPQNPKLPWSGVWHSVRDRDGQYTHRFGVRMMDLNQETGKISDAVDRLEFSVEFE